ncbi:elongation of very long chain fatty acids protein 4 [Strigomonas culicis]|uniref:Elongation of fatty acids protein n=2 Tax=Strigomonas culicis TaxID=28005 RepID=S9UNB9_9TRYP|nr:elongation of very long chain fatty acids protein 4 [Strigomonas culicis]EPY32362.1 elongation of very long chain fatty acids protein 4 [Strigomonas culicis]|eukprot:EPY31800.1 elongation of very long chain fatty acids protein 4 [Strigomonas culicis]
MSISSSCYAKDSLCFHPEFNSYVSYPVLIGGHLSYLLVVFGLRHFMRGRLPFDPKLPMMLYNIAQVGLSLLMAINLAPYLKYNLFNLSGGFDSKIEFWIFVHYATKFLDMFDTLFMVLRKKDEQISFLHVYHHLTIGLIWGLLLHNGIANGTAFFGAWINSSVHAIMYFHYLYTSFGLTNPFKKYITQIQMIQFALCIMHAVLAVVLDNQIPKPWAVLQLCYHMTLLYLFMRFYQKGNRKPRVKK